ncbi:MULTISPECIES: hypothetical protein [Ferrimicrobium]|jgi:hypothetical protein|uniref:hypothetical protein n=1 Tax=Ferrimicrobium TaxID=121038 RepID=UPI0023F3A033|nr:MULTISPECIES: hypothetical protein [Ferrimicrobium]
MGEKRTGSDYIEIVTERPAELFEPILEGMLASVKEQEAERLRKHRERLRVTVAPSSLAEDQNPHLPGDSQTDQAGAVKEEPGESDRS